MEKCPTVSTEEDFLGQKGGHSNNLDETRRVIHMLSYWVAFQTHLKVKSEYRSHHLSISLFSISSHINGNTAMKGLQKVVNVCFARIIAVTPRRNLRDNLYGE